MLRPLAVVKNDMLRIGNYLKAYSPDSLFHSDMQEKMLGLVREYDLAILKEMIDEVED